MSNLVLVERLQSGDVKEHLLGNLVEIKASPGAQYSVVDKDTGVEPDSVSLKRDGDSLQVQVDDQLVASIENFYALAETAFIAGESMIAAQGSEAAATGAQSEGGWSAGESGAGSLWVPGLVALGGVALVASTSSKSTSPIPVDDDPTPPAPPATPESSLTINAAAGPFITTMGVELYDSDGNLLQSIEHDFTTGPVTITFDGDYEGPVLAKIVDINGDAVDYVDETTGESVSLGSTSMRAMLSATPSTAVEVSITPLTELATRLAGVTESNAVTTTNLESNSKVGALFGVSDILGPVKTVVDADYNSEDGLDDAEAYGNVLAILSGTDKVTGSINETLTQIAAAITTDGEGALVLAQTAADTLAQGTNQFGTGVNAAKVDIKTSVPIKVADTTPPTTTINGLTISADSGAADFITNVAAQTISATLSAPLAAGEVLMASTDGGATFTDITAQVSGTTVSFAATLAGSSSIRLRVDDAAGNQGTVVTQTFTIDTTPSAVVISDIQISSDTGADGSDFVTNQPQQTVTGTLSSELADGSVVLGSVDGGETFDDITDQVDGTDLSWDVTIPEGAEIVIRVDDIADNEGTPVSQPVVLDTTAPTISSVVVNQSGLIEITFDEDVSLSTLEAGDFSVIVDNASYEVAGASVEGAVITLQGDFIYEDQVVSSVAYAADAGESGFVVDIAGNAAASDDVQEVTNNSLGQHLSFFGTLEDLLVETEGSGVLDQTAGEGNDWLEIGVSSSYVGSAYISGLDLLQDGAGGTDTLFLGLGGIADYQFNVNNNDLSQQGGDGANDLLMGLASIVTGSDTAGEAGVSYNFLAASGGSGNDVVHIALGAGGQIDGEGSPGGVFLGRVSQNHVEVELGDGDNNAGMVGFAAQVSVIGSPTSSTMGAGAVVTGNSVEGSGGVGVDTLSAQFVVDADAGTSAHASAAYNWIDFDGGDNADTLTASFDADANASTSAYASHSYNYIYLNGGNGADTLSVAVVANADGSDYANAFVVGNGAELEMGSGNDTVDVIYSAEASASQANAVVMQNYLDVYGSPGSNNVDVSLVADASGSSASAVIQYNGVFIEGGTGTDAISVDASVKATGVSNTNAKFVNNDISILAGDGDDVVDVLAAVDLVQTVSSYVTGYFSGNSIDLEGGDGADALTVNLDLDVSGAPFSIAYMRDNEINILGNNGNDDHDILLNVAVNPTSDGEAYLQENFILSLAGSGDDDFALAMLASAPDSGAKVYSNQVIHFAGSGDDSMSVRMSADGSVAAGYVDSNDVLVVGGSGIDTIDVDLQGRAVYNNSVALLAGTGADIIAVGVNTVPSTSNESGVNDIAVYGGQGEDLISLNYSADGTEANESIVRGGAGADAISIGQNAGNLSLQYAALNELGDAVGGVTAEDNVSFKFARQVFNGSTEGDQLNSNNFVGGADAVALDSDDFWLYDSTAFTLSYDADGSGAGAAVVVASFTQDVGLTAGDIDLVNAMGQTLTMTAAEIDLDRIVQEGGTGSDTLSLNASNRSSGEWIAQDGGAGDDHLVVALSTIHTTEEHGVTNNFVLMDGGAGVDTLSASLHAIGTRDGEVSSNTLVMMGGADTDLISASFLAGVVSTALGTSAASASYNMALIEAGAGDDAIDVAFAAVATGAAFSADAGLYVNEVGILAGDGSDTLTIDLSAIAGGVVDGEVPIAPNASAEIVDNSIFVEGGAGDDDVTATLDSTVLGGADGRARVMYNEVEIEGDAGADELGVIVDARATGSDLITEHGSYALIAGNEVWLQGGDGTDTLTVDMTASAFGANGVLATFGTDPSGRQVSINNEVEIDAGAADDFVSVGFAALAGAGSSPSYALATVAGDVWLDGGEGVDAMSFSLLADASATGIAFADVAPGWADVSGGDGNDALTADLAAYASGGERAIALVGPSIFGPGSQETGPSGSGASALSVGLEGGSGDDALNALIQVGASALFSGATAVLSAADFRLDGGDGTDTLTFYAQVDAAGVTTQGTGTQLGSASALALVNGVYIDGGDGDDVISATLNVAAAADSFADASIGGTSELGSPSGVLSGNEFDIRGGAGTDAISVGLAVSATADLDAYAENNASYVWLDGESGDDELSLDVGVSASGGYRAEASFDSNQIYQFGGQGSDSLSVDIDLFAGTLFPPEVTEGGPGYGATAHAMSNQIQSHGGSGDDSLSVDISAVAVGPVAIAAQIINNSIELDGGDGDDVLSVMLSARASDTSLSVTVFEQVFNNYVSLNGGDGIDTISVFFDTGQVAQNTVWIHGGAGADIINFDMTNVSTANDNDFVFSFTDSSQFGDSISGLGNNADAISFAFSGSFNGVTTESGFLSADSFVAAADAIAVDADDFWLYDTDDFILSYDADGSGTGAAVIVATFDQDVHLVASDIVINTNVA